MIALLLTGVVGLLTLIVGALGMMAKKILKLCAETNDAVNMQHERKDADGNVPPKIFDLVWENHKKTDELIGWKRGYDEGPLDNGHKVREFVDDTNKRLDHHSDELRKMKADQQKQLDALRTTMEDKGHTIEEIEAALERVQKRMSRDCGDGGD